MERINPIKLKNKIIKSLKEQGFNVGDRLNPKRNSKINLKKIHKIKRLEQIKKHKKFLLQNIDLVKKFSICGKDIDISKIDLEIREIKPNTEESKIFFWWNLAWWSLPYDSPIGRQMRFIIWDKYHNAPFGLIGLQSPPIASSIRDKFLGLYNGNRVNWINQSMYGQRIGALPPYNELLGGKMVALALVSNELKQHYERKYKNKKTLMEGKKIPARILFITTTSAFGKSSMYDRVKYKKDTISNFIGFTSGAGTFHLSENLYKELLNFLSHKGINIKRGYGTGPSRKLKLVTEGFKMLGLNGKKENYIFHNIKRGYYIFPLVNNLEDVLKNKKNPKWKNYSFKELKEFWLNRWALPRSERKDEWKTICTKKFIEKFEKMVKRI